jgi:diguanylate cyclase (GGDEF)-like protein
MPKEDVTEPSPNGHRHPPFREAQPPTGKPSTVFTSPGRLFIITICAIFLGEALVMFLLGLLPPLTFGQEAFVDSLMLVFIVFPVLVFLVLKPMRLHVTERRRVEDKLRALSVTDELTGLSNRRGFFMMAGKQLNIARRLKKEIVLLYADLDNLKEINDSAGHHVGDGVLVETAEFLTTNFRQSDIIARMGGDEFVILPVQGSDIGALLARFHEAFEREIAGRYRDYGLSISFGTATYDPENPRPLDELLAAADRAMYEQKRNKTCA